ncbi:hypothetical protein NLJ89_g5369 [Agrocybe chaxingu]|uniref:Heme oxygenase n=1 Tax=Agrocybe chaxingu TaxID=84603 RepID=A0A9W8K1D2_9AGAR|nr:hypothetical protein NLJ89_g5369 [Agrocybe chaxingu]
MAIDYSRPLATLLREETKKVHEEAETSTGARRLLSGHLPKEDYVRFLIMLWHVYDGIEKGLDRHATHPTLEPTYNPTLLARAPHLSADIAYLLETEDWKEHPIHKQLLASDPKPLFNYLRRLHEISDSPDPSPLLAHAYVRYLGDLSGGQTIRHTIAKAYGLDEVAGLGVSFYAFKELRTSKPASQGEMKRIKEWFREGMNTAGAQGPEVKALVVEEASRAFVLNTGLFSLVGDEAAEDKEEAKAEASKPSETAYPVSQVVAIIAAVCVAHFALVVGGFTGNAGYQKLLAVEGWLKNLWSSN